MKLLTRHTFLPCLLLLGSMPGGLSAEHARQAPGKHTVQPLSTAKPESPKLKHLPNGHFRVMKSWTVVLGDRRWQVPARYQSNGITAPEFIKRPLGDGVEYPETWAAVFHDWLFTQPGVSRSEADRLFHDLLIAYGVPAPKAALMHGTVSAYSFSKIFR